MRKLKQPVSDKKHYFTKDEWGRMPLKLKQKWWAETNYSTLEPTLELMTEIKNVLYPPATAI